MSLDAPYDDNDLLALDAIVQRIVELGASMAWVTTLDGELLAVCEVGEPGLSEPTTTARARLPEVIVGAMITARADLDAMAAALEDVDRVFARYRQLHRQAPMHDARQASRVTTRGAPP